MTNDLLPDENSSQMPDEIYAGMLSSGSTYYTSHKIEVAQYNCKHAKGMAQTKYIRADLVSTPNKPAEGDLDALKREAVRAYDIHIQNNERCFLSPVEWALDYLAASGHLATGKGGDAPQSDMVAVPREVIEEAAESIRFALNMDDLSDAEFSKLDLSLAMLQPYTKGEK